MTHSDLMIIHRSPKGRPSRQRGFSLLEVLIALLVLSVGLLGIAGLQTISLKFNHQSYERTQATTLISEMYEKIIANPQAATDGVFSAVAYGSPSSSYASGGCPAACATTTELATYDIQQWKLALENPKILAQGTGEILLEDAAAGGPATGVFRITVGWMENDVRMTQTMRARTLHR